MKPRGPIRSPPILLLYRLHTHETVAALYRHGLERPRERGLLSANLSEATDIVQVETLCQRHTKLADSATPGQVVPGCASSTCGSSFPLLASHLPMAVSPKSVYHTPAVRGGGGVRGSSCPIKSASPLPISQCLTILGNIFSSYSRLETDTLGFW